MLLTMLKKSIIKSVIDIMPKEKYDAVNDMVQLQKAGIINLRKVIHQFMKEGKYGKQRFQFEFILRRRK